MTLNDVRRRILSGLAASVLVLLGGHLADAAAPRAGQAFRDCPDCPEMVTIPRGNFMMGSERSEPVAGGLRPEGPVHRVTIPKPFALGKFEVTNAQFERFIAATGHVPSQVCTKWKGKEQEFPGSWRDPDYGRAPQPLEPVVCVSWRDAKAFVAWLSRSTGKSYPLPSEAEWEYVARAGTTGTWPWGEDPAGACKVANVFDRKGAERDSTNKYAPWEPVPCDDGFGGVAPVGSYPPNAFGVYDIIGNVWEWNEDCSLTLYPIEPSDGRPVEVSGECEKRAVRGGSWFSQASRQRSSFRVNGS